MAKDQKPAEELSGIAKQSIEQARGAVDIFWRVRGRYRERPHADRGAHIAWEPWDNTAS
jgi:hypothetical protein